MNASANTPMTDTILNVEHLSMKFGGLVAIGDLSFQVRRGEITALIGPNGAGKTTVFNMITGVYKPTDGHIRWHGRDVTGLPPTGSPKPASGAPSRPSACSPT